MLNLEYILIGKLPETERDILLENLKTEREYGWNVLEWDSAKEHIQEGALAEKTILVSGDAKELSEAQRIGMAVLCYLMPGDGRTQRNEAAAGEMEVTSPADMRKGWRRSTDLFYSMSMRDIIVFRGSF